MAGPYPLATLACSIDSTGISAPPYDDILASLIASFQGIYGSDVSTDPSTQDYQLLAIFAAAINDENSACIAAYNAYSPATAVGAGLSSVVKINGLARGVATNSTVDITIVGQAGTPIAAGIVADPVLGTQWQLPAVTIPPGGTIIETATCTEPGAATALPNTLTYIVNPTRGWQTANNVGNATPGAPIELDPAIRVRQSQSTTNAATTVLPAIVKAVRAVSGVQTVTPYENDTGAPDVNGIPAHSISLIVAGGDAVAIATAINNSKSPGTGTYGTTSETVLDVNGVPNTIHFYRPTLVRLTMTVHLTALAGYTSAVGASIAASMIAYTDALANGGDVYLSKVESAANLNNGATSETFNLTALTMAKFPAGEVAADIAIAFNEQATLALADVTLVVT